MYQTKTAPSKLDADLADDAESSTATDEIYKEVDAETVGKAGELIRNARLEKKISQKELAQRSGVTVVQLCRIENGKCTPTRQTLKKLSGCVGIPYAELLFQAGYNNMRGDNSLYGRDGNAYDTERIIDTIYRRDPELLDYLRDINMFGTPENIQTLKIMMEAMKKEVVLIREEPKSGRTSAEKCFREMFQALKRYLVSSLSAMMKSVAVGS